MAAKSAAKGVVVPSTSQVMKMNNGFESLASLEECLDKDISHGIQWKGGGDTSSKIVQ